MQIAKQTSNQCCDFILLYAFFPAVDVISNLVGIKQVKYMIV